MVDGVGHLCTNAAPCGVVELCGRWGVQGNGQIRLDALPTHFQQINSVLGPLKVDLLTTTLSTQLPCWKLNPETLAMDAFTVNLTHWKAYDNPPWSMVGRVLAQAQQQKEDIVLDVPVWKTQTWYPTILSIVHLVSVSWAQNDSAAVPTSFEVKCQNEYNTTIVKVLVSNKTTTTQVVILLPSSYYSCCVAGVYGDVYVSRAHCP